MTNNPFKEARALVGKNEFKEALDSLEHFAVGTKITQLFQLKSRLTAFETDKNKGRLEVREEEVQRNKISDDILALIAQLESEKEYLENPQALPANPPHQNNRDKLPKEAQLLREKLLKSMRNTARQKKGNFITIDDWADLKLNCQIVLDQLLPCDWDDFNDRLEAYSLINHLADTFQGLLYELKDTENENSELFDLIACANPLLLLMLDDIQLANEGNNRKGSQLASKFKSLKIRLDNIIEELKIIIEIAGVIRWT